VRPDADDALGPVIGVSRREALGVHMGPDVPAPVYWSCAAAQPLRGLGLSLQATTQGTWQGGAVVAIRVPVMHAATLGYNAEAG
jgi:hypothetical protein